MSSGGGQAQLTKAELHLLAEEAVWDCMANAGFDYQMTAFVDAGETDVLELAIDLRNVEDVGYGSVFSALTFLLPNGSPPDPTSRSQLEEYDRALVGAPHSHSSDDVDDHDHFERHGCQGLGQEIRRGRASEVVDANPLPVDANDFFNEVVALDSYQDYVNDWNSCVAQAGLAVKASDPSSHAALMLEELQEGPFQLVQDLLLAENGVGPLSDLSSALTFDVEALGRVLDEYTELAQMHDAEIEIALADQACRDQHADQVRSDAAELLRAE